MSESDHDEEYLELYQSDEDERRVSLTVQSGEHQHEMQHFYTELKKYV